MHLSALKEAAMKNRLLFILLLTLAACTQSPNNPNPNNEPSLTANSERYWNEILELSFWEAQNLSAAPTVYINDKALNDNVILSFDATGLRLKLDLERKQRPTNVSLTLKLNNQILDLNIDGNRQSSYDFNPKGEANANRLNILIPCQENTRSKLERLFEASNNFELVDYFGDYESLGQTTLGASQHGNPLCLMVVSNSRQASRVAFERLSEFLRFRIEVRPIAISPDFYMYSYDPSVASFDSSCDDGSALTEEANSAQAVPLKALASIVSKPASNTGAGVTLALLDGGVANASSFLASSATSALSRSFIEADFPNPNSNAFTINDDFDCDETSFKDGHGSLVESISKELAPNADLLALKVCNDDGSCTTSSFVKAMLYIRNQFEGFPAIDIINMSFGGDVKRDKVFEALLKDMLQTRTQTLVVASLGNTADEEAHYPAQYQNDYPNVIAVAAAKLNTDESWSLADFNTQETLNSLNKEPFAAPGVAIILDGLGNPNGVTGTSFAAPIVSAVAALTKSAEPSLNMRDLVIKLRAQAIKTNNMNFIQVPQ